MKRREFISLLGGAVAWPLAARAQQPQQMRRIGVLMPFAEDDPEAKARLVAFRQGLEKRGWSEGRNIRIDTRFSPRQQRRSGAGTGERTDRVDPDSARRLFCCCARRRAFVSGWGNGL